MKQEKDQSSAMTTAHHLLQTGLPPLLVGRGEVSQKAIPHPNGLS